MSKLKGKDLDKAIEAELKKMIEEGFEQSPISNKYLYDRLINKKIITGAISTLTNRKQLIEEYKTIQQANVGGVFGESLRSGSTKSRNELIKTNAKLREDIKKAEKQLADNTKSLIAMAKHIKFNGFAKDIERSMSPYLIRELNKSNEHS
ncbi:hypothetical protein IX95_14925 [Vibrio sp. B183]|uniref:hypothetical protein n=1 Tax=Vibrio sp. B183 TaxID=1526762 RepID=UPI0004FFFD0B|nr:hypothetical protein [Vibrio sp. B183]KFI11367.1 hypothetical protein IX95_14925 [Vibrio sp. B183]